MCWFARILMYPIVVISLVGMIKKSLDYTSVLILSGLWILLEWYQYRYQMTHSDSDIKSFICGVWDQASCAATDVIYWWFITIPFLCLIAFCIIFIATTLLQNKNSKE
jgi:disulfide bond formation protein DsbB